MVIGIPARGRRTEPTPRPMSYRPMSNEWGVTAEVASARMRSDLVVPRPSELHPARNATMQRRPAKPLLVHIGPSATARSVSKGARERASPVGLLRRTTVQLAVGMILGVFAVAVGILLAEL